MKTNYYLIEKKVWIEKQTKMKTKQIFECLFDYLIGSKLIVL
jgi:hypothetical protein